MADITVTDISPLRALTSLQRLHFWGWGGSDLTPLKGMPLKSLNIGYCFQKLDLTPLAGSPLEKLTLNYSQVSDLRPLRDVPLTTLGCANTPVSDLAPLRGMRLVELNVSNTKVSDLSPLKGMKSLQILEVAESAVTDLSPVQELSLKAIKCDFVASRDAKILRTIKTLEKINGNPAVEFLKKVE